MKKHLKVWMIFSKWLVLPVKNWKKLIRSFREKSKISKKIKPHQLMAINNKKNKKIQKTNLK